MVTDPTGRYLALAFLVFKVLLFTTQVSVDRYLVERQARLVALDNAEKKILERQAFFRNYLAHAVGQLDAVASSEAFARYLGGEWDGGVEEVMRALAYSHADIMRIGIFNADGEAVLGFHRQAAAGDLIDGAGPRDALQPATPGKRETSGSWPGISIRIEPQKRGNGAGDLLSVVKTFASQRQGIRYLVIDYLLAPFLENLMRAPLYRMMLVDRDGEVLFRNDGQPGWSRFRADSPDLFDYTANARLALEVPQYRDEQLVMRRLELPVTPGMPNVAPCSVSKSLSSHPGWSKLGREQVLHRLPGPRTVTVTSRGMHARSS